MADKCWIVYGCLGSLMELSGFNKYNGTSWVFNKTKYREHLKAIAGAGANAIRRIPSAGAWDSHPYGKKSQFCEFRYVNETVGWDLDDFNTNYFDTLGEAINIENSLGLTTFQCFLDNCVYHKASTKIYSPWVKNNNGVNTVYDSDAYPYLDALIDKHLSEFSSMQVLYPVGNEMNNSGFSDLFNTVIHPLVDADTLNPDLLTLGATHLSLQGTVRGYLEAGDRNKVIMEAHGWTPDFNDLISSYEDSGARLLFSDDGMYTGSSTCDKDGSLVRPSASQWYTKALDILTTYGAADGSDNYRLNFEHCPGFYPLSTTCQAATIAKIREAYEVWAATLGSPPPPGPGQEDIIPAAPSGLTATISGATTATLAWTDNSINELDFHIEKSTTFPGTSGFAEITTVATDIVTYGATGLTEGASVWFRVRAHNAAGYSDYTTSTLAVVPAATSYPKPARRMANLPYPFGFKSLDEVRDYLIKLRSKLEMTDFTVNMGDIINTNIGALLPRDGVFYEMLKCDDEILSWGWREGIGNTFLGLDVIAGGDTTGGYDTYLGYRAGYYSTTATANVSVGSGSGEFLRTTYTIDSNVSYQFTLRRTGGVAANSPYALFKFGDYLISREYDPDDGVHVHRTAFLKSTDGINWTEWFYINTYSHYKAYSCVEFSNKLYINWYNANPNPRLQIWDGNTVTTAFTSVAYDNQLAGPMIVSGAKLWILTDVDSYNNNRRVVYWTADGTTYNAITDYDYGTDPHASYLHYNHEAYLPAVGTYVGRFLCNRWLEFKGVLYLFASIYNTANAKWSWQVWQTGTTTFTKIYDSGVLNDGYCISSVVTDGEFVIVTGNTLETGGSYEDDCRVYRSTNMTNWGVVATLAGQGLCYESMEYGKIFYSMFVIQAASDYYVKIYYWDDENSVYVQCDNNIITEDHYVSGNFIEYRGSFFVGKWKEIYELTRVKSPSVTVTTGTASGNTIVGASAGDMPIAGSLDCLYGYNSNLSSPEVENGIAIGAYSRVSRDNTLVLGGTDTYQVDVAIGQTYAIGRLHVHQYGEKEIDTYGLYIDNIATNTAFDGINKYGLYVTSTGAFTGSTGTGTKNYGLYLPAVTGADTNYGFYCVSNITTEDQFISSLAIGTKPLDVTSTTVCTNLNVDLLDGSHGTAFAPVGAKYIVQELDATLTAEQSLGALATGILKNTTTATVGVLSIAVGTDLPAHVLDSSVHSVSGLTTGHFLKATGATTFGFAAHGLTSVSVGAEPALGNPGTSGFVLSSTDAGVRSWIAAGGALALDDLTDVDVTTPADNDIIRYDSGSSTWQHEALPAAANHDILSATHADTTAAAVVAGAIIMGDDTPKWIRLLHGNEGDVLTVASGLPGWAAPGGASHVLLSATHTDTLADTVVRGDVMIGNSTPKWSRLAKGAANQVFGGDGTDSKWVTACPAAAKYIVGLVHADLSAEKVKAQLYNNYDIDDTPAAPNALDDEFDDSSLDVKWTIVNNPATTNWTETTYPGFIYAGVTETATTDVFDNYHRIYQASPATGNFALTIIAKVSIAAQGIAGEQAEWGEITIYLADSTNDEWIGSTIQINNLTSPTGHGAGSILWSYGCYGGASGIYTAMATVEFQNVPVSGFVYLKLEKTTTDAYTSANTYNTYFSLNGITWHQTGTRSHTFTSTCEEIGIMCRPPKAQTGSPTTTVAVDFFRRTV